MTQHVIKTISRKIYLGFGIVLMLVMAIQPAFVSAATDPSGIDPSTTTTTGPTSAPSTSSASGQTTPPSAAGTTQPTGSSAKSFTYNATTGLWENQYYTWDPVTRLTQPKTPLIYVYNSATNMYDMAQWVWNAAKGAYQQITVSVSTPPPGALTSGSPQIAKPDVASNPQSNAGSNAGSTTSVNNLGVDNNINSTALTGNATITNNTTAGSAASGSAQTVANVMNLLQSTSSLAGPNTKTFVSNITGNVQGNLLIDPSMLQPATSQTGFANGQINAVTNGKIDNNISLNATSGNATVANNTKAGNAITGSADAVANVVNVMNSAIASNQSFLGVVNIYGNLTGNILVPAQLLNTLIASNVPKATLDTSQISNGNILQQFNNNETINNNVSATASSGSANVTDNSNAGSATTGNANTNVTIFNLTGQQVVGANSLLVFVNVLGKWVGLIMNAPSGSTAAELGGGITQDSQLAGTNINSTNNNTINNNIRVNAQSGDANVDHNTTAGNATSGNATASANLLNVTNSQLSFSNWFGVLFINVFGTWNGSFGTYDNTPASITPTDSSSATATSSTTSNNATERVQAFRFVQNGQHNYHLVSVISPTNTQVLGASTHVAKLASNNAINDQGVKSDHIMYLPIIASLFCLLILATSEIRTTWKHMHSRMP